METTTIKAGSGEMVLELPAEWVKRSLLEGGNKLAALSNAVREFERFDFKHFVYPRLVREREERQARDARKFRAETRTRPAHNHIWATIKKKLRARGMKPYCLKCGETEETTNPET